MKQPRVELSRTLEEWERRNRNFQRAGMVVLVLVTLVSIYLFMPV